MTDAQVERLGANFAERFQPNRAALVRLLAAVCLVTDPHRAGRPVSRDLLDDLVKAQEEALQRLRLYCE